MSNLIRILWALAASFALGPAWAAAPTTLRSPDRHLQVQVWVSPEGEIRYTVQRDGRMVLLDSRLGLQLEGADLSTDMRLTGATAPQRQLTQYRMATGKQSRIRAEAMQQVLHFINAQHQHLDLWLRVANDGVAFRYGVPPLVSGQPNRFVAELSSFHFDAQARAWLQPMSVAKTGWMRTNPSYEEHYAMDTAVGSPSPSAAGWVFPALFKSGDDWVALTEADMDGSFHASRLQPQSPGGEYRLGLPMASEVFTDGRLLAQSPPGQALRTPWRVIAVGSLPTLVASTLGTDLAAPAIAFDASRVQPGHASWSWALLKDEATVFEVQKRFIDHAADMHWNYTLVDADWDRKIGDARIQALVDYGASKGVGLLLWYNSSGAWNDTEYSPKGQLLTRTQRRHEFARLNAMGVKGVKIDFFPGDGQSAIQYYVDILNDAAEFGLLVNFHGATLPRGWQRTYPNLMSMEAVKGLEYTTFTQADQDAVPRHVAMLPFTRNLFDPMDFTPLVLADIPGIRRATLNGFELAESVLMLSGIQHFAETPEGMATAPGFAKQFLQTLPRQWDEVRLLAGEPGRYVALARRAGSRWFVAGLNAEDTEIILTLDLDFLKKMRGKMITDEPSRGPRALQQSVLKASGKSVLRLVSHGGFVAVFEPVRP
ncbi:glycoside hydrolase family 97 protein [Roseateles koreensis]|uniref:Glycoside hydrolase family 97 catalytic domain-containing protein n=1 Tax=Roseateles koreensis TaxID=2987526 RepID=A0ABT5KU80_9BURK|nr:glycoside hydrolase family 97 protein [Roseateles koreensis]MDC8786479.1 glycoside hydrolase family 97 catalytic domain-containing protein [Roseateles koreensis]